VAPKLNPLHPFWLKVEKSLESTLRRKDLAFDPGGNMSTRSLGARIITVMLALSITAPPFLEGRIAPTHGFDMFSPQEEVQGGQQATGEVSKQLPLSVAGF
jgi:hypothetical protein